MGKGKDFGMGGKDLGEGGKDYGKGCKDSGKGGEDSGKGYQGACFNCGKVGHKAWECRRRKQVGAVDEENYGNDEGEVQAGAVESGTIWNIGVEINKVQKMEAENDPKTKAIEITLDSGAGASCWPAKLLKNIPMKEKDKGVRFKAAYGTEQKNYGTKNIKFQSEGEICDMKFHVTDTTKPLASAAAIAKMGNRVVLEDSRTSRTWRQARRSTSGSRAAPMCWTLIASPMRRFSAGGDKLREKRHWGESCKTRQK